MWRKWLAAAILAGAMAAIGAAQAKFLTNDDIVSMVKGGQSDDAILTAIQGNGTDFDVSVKAMLALKKGGVSKKVIDTMVQCVKDQKEAAAATITLAQQKAAAQEADDKAEQAREDAARAQRAGAAMAAAVPGMHGATAMPGAMGMPGGMSGTMGMPVTMGPIPGMPSVTMVQNGQKQPLGLAHTQIVPTNMPLNGNQMQAPSTGAPMNGMNGMSGPGASMGSLANDASLGSNLGSLAKMFAGGGGMPGIGGMGGGMNLPIGLPGVGGGKGAGAASAIASTMMMANPMLSGAMIAGSLLKHKAEASQAAAGAMPGQGAAPGMGMGMMPGQPSAAAGMGQNTMTAVWAIPGARSETVVHSVQLAFEVQLDGTTGVNPDEYEPVLIRLTSTQSNFRLVGATTMNPNQIQSTDVNWNLYASFVEQRVPATATKASSGRYTLQVGPGLTAGEYGVVLRPVSRDKKFAGNNVSQNVGDGLVFNCVWTFEVQ